MKIAIICTEKLTFPPINGGAVQVYLEGALPILSKHHEITVFSIQDPKLPNRASTKWRKIYTITCKHYRGVCTRYKKLSYK